MPAQQVLRIFFKLFPPLAYAVRSDSVRRPIGFRTPSNRIPYAVRSDSVRVTMTFREGFIANICQAERLIAAAKYFFTCKPTYL